VAVFGVVGGIIIGGVATYQAWRAPDGFDRTAVGGALSIHMDAGADAVIYYEGQPVPPLAALGLTITSPTGDPVAISGYDGTLNYDRNDVVATAVGRFTSADAGLYQLTSSAPNGFASLAVGRDLAGLVFVGLGGAAAVAVIGILLAVGILALPQRRGSAVGAERR
jgi:hypothetical protein